MSDSDIPIDLPALNRWLERINRELGRDHVEYISRPFSAISKWGTENNCAVHIPSSFSTAVFKWFEDHSPAGAHSIGTLFSGLFYYDSHFWEMHVPLSYGRVTLNAMDALASMPFELKDQLKLQTAQFLQYVTLWADTIDYGLGMSDIGMGKNITFGKSFVYASNVIASAHRELTATVRLLTAERRPNTKAFETSRMSIEMFLKAYLAIHEGLDDTTAQKVYGHNLAKLTRACCDTHPHSHLEEIEKLIAIFPNLGTRYEEQTFPKESLWVGYTTALLAGVTLLRTMTGRNSRNQLKIR